MLSVELHLLAKGSVSCIIVTFFPLKYPLQFLNPIRPGGGGGGGAFDARAKFE